MRRILILIFVISSIPHLYSQDILKLINNVDNTPTKILFDNAKIKISEVADSTGERPSKIVFYAFPGVFYGGSTGPGIRDNFYKLMLGEKVNLSEYPYKVFESKEEICDLMDVLDSFKAICYEDFNYPSFNYNLNTQVFRNYLMFEKYRGRHHGCVWALIMLFYQYSTTKLI